METEGKLLLERNSHPTETVRAFAHSRAVAGQPTPVSVPAALPKKYLCPAATSSPAQTRLEYFVLKLDGGVLLGFIGKNTSPPERRRAVLARTSFVQEIFGKILHFVAGLFWQNLNNLHERHSNSFHVKPTPTSVAQQPPNQQN
jgi:hypothetical protein